MFGPDTTTLLVTLEVPPGPVQLSPYVVVAASGPVLKLPAVGRLPLHPPEAVQDVASVVVHEIMEALPAVTDRGWASIRMTGGKATTTVTVVVEDADPTGLVHVSV
ncbi:MAG: hypothetical protein AB7G76_02490 [Steroidobacteraceae bacterium]